MGFGKDQVLGGHADEAEGKQIETGGRFYS